MNDKGRNRNHSAGLRSSHPSKVLIAAAAYKTPLSGRTRPVVVVVVVVVGFYSNEQKE